MLTATVRQELEGAPFHMFDFFPVAFGTALCGVVFLSFGWRLIPRGRRSAAADTAFKIEDYTSELRVGSGSSFAGRRVAELEDAAGDAVTVVAIVRDEYRRYVPGGSWAVLPNDLLVVEADPQALTAALAIALLSLLSLSELYAAVEWPILIMIGALIPIGEAVKSTGTTDLLAGLISGFATHLPAYGVLAVILAVTMMLTPILHHAAAVLVMGPIAAELAQNLGYKIDPFLIAVALGAGSDFLSPIGHQSNTLVMGPGGYHFADYWKLGLPLSLIVAGIGVPLILLFWPLR